ncbi:MAG TPA: M20/M25/M40 family metallo-hydrolase, partial [Anaerolineae bacterium]|nr:M20/M25/M40 family metallo-hydrolase [Anaerolineae bacterium]
RVKRWQRPQRLTPVVIEMLQALAPNQPFPKSILFTHANHPFLWPFIRNHLAKDPFFASLICDTLNLTILSGGRTSNVIPAWAEAKLDVRLLPGEDPIAFLNKLRSVVSDPKVSIEIEGLPPSQHLTSSQTPFYQALATTLKAHDPAGQVTPYLTPGATDSRFFRAAGMSAYGFVPMRLNDKELSRIHGIDERVAISNLRWGIQVVYETLRKL